MVLHTDGSSIGFKPRIAGELGESQWGGRESNVGRHPAGGNSDLLDPPSINDSD